MQDGAERTLRCRGKHYSSPNLTLEPVLYRSFPVSSSSEKGCAGVNFKFGRFFNANPLANLPVSLSVFSLFNPVQLQNHPLMTIFSRCEAGRKGGQHDIMAAARLPSCLLKGKAVSPTCRSYIFKSFKTEEG